MPKRSTDGRFMKRELGKAEKHGSKQKEKSSRKTSSKRKPVDH